jgi:hypothetical protein
MGTMIPLLLSSPRPKRKARWVLTFQSEQTQRRIRLSLAIDTSWEAGAGVVWIWPLYGLAMGLWIARVQYELSDPYSSLLEG